MKLNPGFPWQKQHSTRGGIFSPANWTYILKCYSWSTTFYGAENWTLRKVDQKYLGKSFEIWCWKRMEKISWTDSLKNEEELQRIKEEVNICLPARPPACTSVCSHVIIRFLLYRFSRILYLRIFPPTFVEEIQVSLKSDKNNGYFT